MRWRAGFGILAIPALLSAQVDQANITGTVTDPAGLPVSMAAIDVLFGSTGLSRTTRTGDRGTYAIAALPLGECKVTIRARGFQSQQIDHLMLTVGETRTLDVRLGIAGIVSEVQVLSAAAPMDRTSAAIGDVIERQQIEELPLNGRNWATLMMLSPGAINSGSGNQTSIRFAGHGLDDNKYQLDGVDATGILHQAQKTDIRLQISAESIAEFRVNGALYTAEHGGVTGGQIDVVSKTGTNHWHGGGFEYLRNNALDARSPFDPAALPAFRLNQFGGGLSGPIVRNQSFLFVDYEGLRQILGQTLIGFVPSAPLRAAAALQSPQLEPLLKAYPAGTNPTSNPEVEKWVGQGRQTQREDSGIVRFDQRFDDSTTGYLRWSIDRARLGAPLGDSSGYLRDTIFTADQPQNGMVKLTHVFSPRLINETRVGVNRVPFSTANQSYQSQDVQVPGFTTLHDDLSQVQHSTTWSARDTMTYSGGRHSVKAGVEFRRVQINLGNTAEEIYSYTSADNFAADKLSEADLLAAVPTEGMRKTEYYGFVQDEFRASPNLTVNAGLRYEYFGAFSEVKGRDRPFDPNTCGGFCPLGSAFYFPDPTDFAPRLGITWSPQLFGGKTTLRTGGGLYYGEGQLGDLNAPLNNLTSRIALTSINIPQLSYPITPFIRLGESASTPRALDRDRKSQRNAEWGFTIEQELPAEMFLEIGYLGSKGTHIFSRTYTNAIDPLTGQRPTAGYGLIDYKRMDDNSEFEALLVRLRRRFGAGWLWSANYMWSHSIDDGSFGGGDADYPENIACQRCERASSDQDIRHDFTTSMVYDLPFGARGQFRNSHAWIGGFLNGWQIAGLASARSGLPLTVSIVRNAADLPDGNNNYQRPNLVPGVPLTPPDGSSPSLWIDPAAFAAPAPGTWGDAGRNLVRGPGIWQVDASLTKEIAVSDHLKLEFRTEIFNLFNRSQYGLPNANLSAPGSFGQITQPLNAGATGTGTPRQIQLALRLKF